MRTRQRGPLLLALAETTLWLLAVSTLIGVLVGLAPTSPLAWVVALMGLAYAVSVGRREVGRERDDGTD
jgi:hypothetical protein